MATPSARSLCRSLVLLAALAPLPGHGVVALPVRTTLGADGNIVIDLQIAWSDLEHIVAPASGTLAVAGRDPATWAAVLRERIRLWRADGSLVAWRTAVAEPVRLPAEDGLALRLTTQADADVRHLRIQWDLGGAWAGTEVGLLCDLRHPDGGEEAVLWREAYRYALLPQPPSAEVITVVDRDWRVATALPAPALAVQWDAAPDGVRLVCSGSTTALDGIVHLPRAEAARLSAAEWSAWQDRVRGLFSRSNRVLVAGQMAEAAVVTVGLVATDGEAPTGNASSAATGPDRRFRVEVSYPLAAPGDLEVRWQLYSEALPSVTGTVAAAGTPVALHEFTPHDQSLHVTQALAFPPRRTSIALIASAVALMTVAGLALAVRRRRRATAGS